MGAGLGKTQRQVIGALRNGQWLSTPELVSALKARGQLVMNHEQSLRNVRNACNALHRRELVQRKRAPDESGVRHAVYWRARQ